MIRLVTLDFWQTLFADTQESSSRAHALRLDGVAAALAETDEACVCDLSWVMERAENLVSHHLGVLRRAELVSSRRDGKMVLYSLTDRGRRLAEVAAAESREAIAEP